MKRTLSLLLALCILVSLVPAAIAEAPEAAGHTWEVRTYPLYVANDEMMIEEAFPLIFMDGIDDLPWIDLEVLALEVTNIMANVYGLQGFNLDYRVEGASVTLERENTYDMIVNLDDNTITFDDYNGFLSKPNQERLLDMLSYSGFNEDGEAALFQRDTEASYDRYGDAVTIHLNDYDISLTVVDNHVLMPLQTANDLVFSPMMHRAAMFNGQGVFVINGNDLDGREGDLSGIGELYYSAQPTQRSQALSDFGLNELSLMLDYHYGLKEKHDIASFRKMFWQMGLDEALASADPVKADQALHNFLSFTLDDVHTFFQYPSWMTGPENVQRKNGPSRVFNDTQEGAYKELRAQVQGPENVMDYLEVGNTAYITFDGFSSDYSADGYYAMMEPDGDYCNDTIGLIIAARKDIFRENSPIENVVIDLTCNTGGQADAALFVISWILGKAEVSVVDALTGAQSTLVYRADVNLDHQFDEQDTLNDKRVYCLISPVSFSCGNLVPSVCKAHQAVTLIGRTSGGGACVVQPLSTAWGSMFNISGNNRLSFRRNGSFYDIDEGIDPDIYIDHLETLYDRQALTDLINNLK